MRTFITWLNGVVVGVAGPIIVILLGVVYVCHEDAKELKDCNEMLRNQLEHYISDKNEETEQ